MSEVISAKFILSWIIVSGDRKNSSSVKFTSRLSIALSISSDSTFASITIFAGAFEP